MTKIKLHFSQKTMSETKSKFAFKINTGGGKSSLIHSFKQYWYTTLANSAIESYAKNSE